MLCRSRSARARLASTVASACWTTDSRRSTSATMRCCSARGGRGNTKDRMIFPFKKALVLPPQNSDTCSRTVGEPLNSLQ